MKLKIGVVLALAVIAGLVRIHRLDVSSHFLFDESRDLVNIHQIWVEKKITLVGPISEDRSHVYSSLTYYMMLPFAVLYDFDPLGPAVGAVFWGLVTAGLFVWCIRIYNPRMVWLAAGIGAIWFPFVQLSRWSWNPNLIFVWFFLGLILAKNNRGVWQYFSGLALGMTMHHHYLAVIPLGVWVLWKKNIFVVSGMFSAFLPFVIFDLRHPPGIFITRMIGYNSDTVKQNMVTVLMKIPATILYFYDFVFQNRIFAAISMAGTLIIAAGDVINKRTPALGWFFIWLISLIPVTLFQLQPWYLFSAIPFFLLWLFDFRDGKGRKAVYLLGGMMIYGSLATVPGLWKQPDWQGDLRIVRGVTDVLTEQISSQKLVNPNLAVLGSKDIYTNGNRYRNMLMVKNVKIKLYEEYHLSDNLFVITTSPTEILRKDPAAEIMYFRNGPVAGVWEIPNTGWRVVQFNRY